MAVGDLSHTHRLRLGALILVSVFHSICLGDASHPNGLGRRHLPNFFQRPSPGLHRDLRNSRHEKAENPEELSAVHALGPRSGHNTCTHCILPNGYTNEFFTVRHHAEVVLACHHVWMAVRREAECFAGRRRERYAL